MIAQVYLLLPVPNGRNGSVFPKIQSFKMDWEALLGEPLPNKKVLLYNVFVAMHGVLQ